MLLVEYPLKHVARISLNRPEKHNAFNASMISELKNKFIECNDNQAIRIIILTGSGEHFSAGADLNWMKNMVNATEQENYSDALALADLMQTLNNLSKPTIAVVQGAVMGGAIGLVACCDVAIASIDAYFCFSEVKIGLIPAVISPYIFKAIGEHQMRRYFLSAEKISAEKAQQLGLIHECVAKENLDESAMKFVKHFSRNSPQAMTQAKELIKHVAHHPLDKELIHYTADKIAKIRISKEGQEGLKAFLEKRDPTWLHQN